MNRKTGETALPIREYTPADYPAVRALWELLELDHPTEDSPAALDTYRQHNPGLFLVATDPAAPATIVGTVVGTYDGRQGYLYHMAVHPDHQRAGHGHALMQEIVQRLWARGAARITLRTLRDNAPALAFYRAFGLSLDDHEVGMTLRRT